VHETAVLYANRAAANISLENYGSALADAEKAVALDASYAKASRRLSARAPSTSPRRAGVL